MEGAEHWKQIEEEEVVGEAQDLMVGYLVAEGVQLIVVVVGVVVVANAGA